LSHMRPSTLSVRKSQRTRFSRRKSENSGIATRQSSLGGHPL
jgi:hypothetical protein